MIRLRFHGVVGSACLGVCLTAGLIGCGSGGKGGGTGETDSGAASSAASGDSGSAATTASREERPNIGGIPLDVWFQDPIAESQKQGTVAVANTTPTAPKLSDAGTPADTGTPKPTPAEMPAEEPAEPAAGGGSDDWKALISSETLLTEVKTIRSSLTDGLQTIGKYNAHYKEMQADAPVLAALAGVAQKHPDAISWKANGKFVRDLAAEVGDKADGLGNKPFEATKIPFEKLTALLNGETPADLPEAADDMPFSEVAKRSGLMKRMEKSFQFMKSNVTSAETMKKESDKIMHEAAVLATLAKVVGTEGYASADEEEYQGFVKKMIEANQKLIEAVKSDNFDGFSEANSQSQKACDECHLAYRFAEDL